MLTKNTEELIKEFRIHDTDIGSCQVQVALLTKRIAELTEHLKKYKKDFNTQRSLLKLVAQRKKFLKYLHRHDLDSYKNLVQKLGLRS